MNEAFNWQPGMSLAQVEKTAILQAFRFYRGNKASVASALGVSIETLTLKLDSYQKEEKEQERITHEHRKQREEFQQRSRGTHPATPAPAGGTSFSSTDAGVSVEPAAHPAQEQAVPVPERKEVQSVLSYPATKGRPRKARR
jgi:hypothetical protein